MLHNGLCDSKKKVTCVQVLCVVIRRTLRHMLLSFLLLCAAKIFPKQNLSLNPLLDPTRTPLFLDAIPLTS